MLRLRSDEQLVSLLRGGSQDAFRAIHERYGQRLFAYVRQMLGPGSRQDAEDVLQDVFARTYTMLKSDDREVNLRPWLYRVAHNRCIDHLRRPGPVTTELVETSAKALHDPFEEVQRREDLQRLVADIARLPDQQKSALLLREINGLSYRELAETLDVTVPAVKSLLVRARVELVETAEAREVACSGVREELSLACDGRSSRPSPRVRRHLRDCAGCRDYQAGIRGMRRSFAALSPVAVVGPLAVVAKVAGFGGSGGGAGTGASAGGTGMAGGLTGGGLAAGTAGKVAAVVSTAAITAGGAVEIERRVSDRAKGSPATEAQQSEARGRTAGDSLPAVLPGAGATPGAAADEPRDSGAAPGRRRDREGTSGSGGERRDSPAQKKSGSRGAADKAPAVAGPVAGSAPGERDSGGTAPAGPERSDGGGSGAAGDSGPGGGGGNSGPGGEVPAERIPSPAGAPAAPVAPRETPAAPPKAPSLPKKPAPTVPVDPSPVPPVEAPALPPVKDNGKLKPDKLKPDNVPGPKPGRGPKVEIIP